MDIQPASPSSPMPMPMPAQLKQTGGKNTHVSHAEKIVINHHVCPYSSNPFSLLWNKLHRADEGPVEVDDEYYNLFVTDEKIINNRLIIHKRRALQANTEIVRELAPLTREVQERIKTFPSLIMQENELFGGLAKPEQEAYFGFVTRIRVQENGYIRIRFRCLAKLNQQAINDIANYLDIHVKKGVMELNETHWTVKSVNLIEELFEAGLLSDGQIHTQEEHQWQTNQNDGQAYRRYPNTSA
jgi:hypothetical protein